MLSAAKSLSVSVVVPTYKEAQNLPVLLDRLGAVRRRRCPHMEVIIVDDDSCDGTEHLLTERGEEWVTVIVRRGERGLSSAVCAGLERARSDVLVVMDADLSHPPEAIPALLDALEEGSDFVVGSRYIAGASIASDWSIFRWLNSRVATLLARPLTRLKDPMSGFFAIRRSTYLRGAPDLNPMGYKIGLELLLKCNCKAPVEIPIRFENRHSGVSKMTAAVQLDFVRHLRHLFIYRYRSWARLVHFLVIGGIGAIVNLAVLTAGLMAGMGASLAIGSGIFISLVSNFLLNRRFTFSYAKEGSMLTQFLGFGAACSLGAVINFLIATSLVGRMPEQLAALIGIGAGGISNFVVNRFVVFREGSSR